jgi:hypothetical protein
MHRALALVLVAGCAGKVVPPGAMKVGFNEPAEPPMPEIAIAEDVARDLDTGFVEPIDLRVPGATDSLVGHCRIVYDLWDDVYVVEQDGAKRTFKDRRDGLVSCVKREALRRARAEALANRRPFSVHAERHELEPRALGLRGHDFIWCAGASDERMLHQPFPPFW